jgi:acyl-CoA reductase-like NAD-dependent aldehyde dehydrogenase
MEAKAGEQFSTARHWIDGEWIEGLERAQSINPASGEVIGTYTEAERPRRSVPWRPQAASDASTACRRSTIFSSIEQSFTKWTSPPKMSA